MQLQFPAAPDDFTKAERKIMEYIYNHTDEFLFMSIGQLSDRLELSDATLSRFARHVGCKDFKDLKHVVMEQNSGSGPAGKLAGTLLQDNGFTVQNWLLRQQFCLQRTLEQLDTSEFERAVQAILKAEKIFIHGKNASSPLARLLFFRLRRLGLGVSLLPSGGSEVLEGLSQAGENDLVIMFSFSKISSEGRMILDYQKEAGYRTLAFTSRLCAPPDQKSGINLFVYRGEEREYHSMSAPAAVADALAVALSERLGSPAAERLGHLHQLKKKYAGKLP
ncbi:MurR/RpiR family transcriptional regulator [Lachnospiraceae bacterium 54-53]